jgi:hypothetical protein
MEIVALSQQLMITTLSVRTSSSLLSKPVSALKRQRGREVLVEATRCAF